MMHVTGGVSDGVTFTHNGDFSGNVVVTVSSESALPEPERVPTADAERTFWRMEIPFTDLKHLVAEYVRDHEHGRIEDSSDDEILGILDV